MKADTYQTTNLYLAAYLLVKKLEYGGIEGDTRKTFIFIDSSDREIFENQFTSKRNCKVDVWDFITALKILKSELYK